MTDTNAEGGSQPSGPRFSVLGQYIKDLSFENPNAPRSLANLDQQPHLDLKVNVKVQHMTGEGYEVTLMVRAEAKHGEEVTFLLELDYAGMFQLAGVAAEQAQPILASEGARYLFPFARSLVTDITRDSGLPPLVLQPMDFTRMAQQAPEQG